MNYIDFVIILVLLFYALEGASSGFLASLLDLISFVISFSFGLSFYKFFGKLFSSNFSIPTGFANAIGFFVAAFIAEMVASVVLKVIFSPYILRAGNKKIIKVADSFLGALMAALSGLLLVSFILTMALTLPLSPVIKKTVSDSKISRFLTSNTQGLATTINGVFGQAANETLSFLTVEPKGNESVNLNFQTSNVKVDPAAENEMFNMVNNERTSRGIKALSQGSALVEVARAHCKDMFIRGYFSHYTPEGLSPFDRMTNAGISFNFAGENLALAPNVELAMRGLMQSPGHRENILSTDFGRVGVGVIDGGIYGEMFCQEFTN